MSTKRWVGGFIALGMLLSSFAVGVVAGYRYPEELGLTAGSADEAGETLQDKLLASDPQDDPEVQAAMDVFWRVWEILQTRHVDRPGESKDLVYGAINGFLTYGMQDEFSSFLPPDLNEIAEEDISGSFGGVGIELEMRSGELTIVAPLHDTPGEQAGLLAGDVITAVDGEDIGEQTLMEVVQKIRGRIGTEVKLSIQRIDEEGRLQEFDTVVQRANIDVESVTWEPLEQEGYYLMEINSFAGDTIEEWDRAVEEILAEDANPQGIVLDLRNNAGGYVTAAVHVISDFIREGAAIIIDRGEGQKETFDVSGFGRLYDVKLNLMINYGTASAAEMITGAIEDYERGTVYGVRTFGKGVIQEIFPIDIPGEDKEASLRLVTAKWYTPDERWIQYSGLEPDVEVQPTIDQRLAGEDPVLNAAVEGLGE